MPGARSRLGARGIRGSAISIAASTPISSAWRPHGAMAVCAFPIHVRRMGTCGRAAAGDKPAVAFVQTLHAIDTSGNAVVKEKASMLAIAIPPPATPASMARH
jgi:hypothetical protein